VHSNIVQHPNCGGGGGGGFAAMSGGGYESGMSMSYDIPEIPLAMSADGNGAVVPLSLYPPAFDISGLLIYDPSISDWVFGSQYTGPRYGTAYSMESDSPESPSGGGNESGGGADD